MNKVHFIVYRIFVNVIGVGLAAVLFKHIQIDTFLTLMISALLLTALNAFVKPALLLMTLPLQLVTFGLFYLVVNAIVLELTSFFISGFVVDGFWTAIGGSLIISIVNVLFDVFSTNSDMRYIYWTRRK
ncbi:phage holin family protein [Flexistipes sp.]|uniref:phage holin family protein n=1 Tax=Flexistipes sp. TaxID=3088135 RepID=UPI002E24F6C0|nr:phage holin family protein [Flexistipes sp.]